MISQRIQIRCQEYGEWISQKEIEVKTNRIADIKIWESAVNRTNKELQNKLGLRVAPIKFLNHQTSGFSIRFEAISGSLTIKNVEFLISPKYLGNTTDNSWIPILHQMIEFSRSNKFNLKMSSFYSQTTYNSFIDILALSLCNYLDVALNKGLIAIYVSESQYSNFVKGQIKIKPNIIKHLTEPHKFLIETDELSIQNPFNEIIKWVIVNLISEVRNLNVKKRLSLSLEYFNEVPLKNPSYTLNNFINLNLPPQFGEYKQVINLCIWYINNSVGVSGKIDGNSYGVVINTERVFEEFLTSCLKAISLKNSFNLVSQKKFPFAIENLGQEKHKSIQPDNLIVLNNEVKLIIDAKYKGRSYDNVEKLLDLKRDDLFQMVSYSIGLKCDYSLVIFPYYKYMNPSIREWKVAADECRNIIIQSTSLNLSLLSKPQGLAKLIKELKNVLIKLI